MSVSSHSTATVTGDQNIVVQGDHNVIQIEAALSPELLAQLEHRLAAHLRDIFAPDVSGAKAVAFGSEIKQFVQQTNLPLETLIPLLEQAETLQQRGVATLDAGGQTLRVFIASPGDVKDERRLALKVLDKLRTHPFCRNLNLEGVAWDKPDASTPLLVGIDPQTAITQGRPKPSACDVFVAVFWSRMGTPLDSTRYTKPDGSAYRSGTEWELEEALTAFNATGRPRILIYRRTEEVLLSPRLADFKEKVEQWERVQAFFATFNRADGSIRIPYNAYETPSHFGDLLEQHLRQVLAQLIDEQRAPQQPTPQPAPATPAWPAEQSPFPGLRAFREADAPIFFGRGAETDQLLKRLSDTACRFLAVVGASGSGKSSLVGAGLIPRLRTGALPGSEHWPVMQMTPDEQGQGDPFEALTIALSPVMRLAERDKRESGERLRANAAGLRAVLEEHLARAPEWHRAVLFIDQFEETFTRVRPDLRPAFCAALEEAARSPRALIVVTLRDDFYHYCVQSPVLARLINAHGGAFNLSAPTPLELHEMVTGPARVTDLTFEAGLARELLTDTGSDAGALALLAFALDQLYQAAIGKGEATRPYVLTRAAYRALGDAQSAINGVQGAIGVRAREVFDALPSEAQATLPQVFRDLVEVDESGATTRKRAALTHLQNHPASAQLIQALVQARLLVTSKGAGDDPLVEVAHEALFRSWDRLRAWIAEARDDLILLRQVRAATHVWEKQNRHAAYRWPDERLQPVSQMQARLTPEWSVVERDFIRSEVDRLLEEIDNPATTHRRRSVIGERLDTLGDPRPGVGLVRAQMRPVTGNEIRLWGNKPEHLGLPDMVWVKVKGVKLYRLQTDASDQSVYDIAPFYLAKYLVTDTQFQAFIDAPDGFKDPRWWQALATERDHKSGPAEQSFKFGNHPRVNVSWYDTLAFCRWLNARLGWPDIPVKLAVSLEGGLTGLMAKGGGAQTLSAYRCLRLPTEWEWQWAASPKDAAYPWGNDWDSAKANTYESGLVRTIAVGMYPAGAAHCGALDLSGNVQEWCLNEYDKPSAVGLAGYNTRVAHGGSWRNNSYNARAAYRSKLHPDYRDNCYGFRVMVRPPSQT